MHEITLTAHARGQAGKTNAKKLRGQGQVPAVVYGHGKSAMPVVFNSAELVPLFKSGTGENTIITLNLDGGATIKTIIREVQTEPIKNRLLHIDLQEIRMDEKIKVRVPLETVGTPEGVKNQGGILEHVMDVIEISCLPGDMPDKITVDISGLKVGQSLHIRDIPLDKFEMITEGSHVVATVIAPLVETAPAPEVAEVETKEPEVISKGKKEEEEAES